MNYRPSSLLATAPGALLSLVCSAAMADAAGSDEPVAPETNANPPGISLYLDAGYASSYVFRGVNQGNNWGEARAEAAIPLTDSTSFSVGGKFGAADGYDEAQAFASLQQSLGMFTAALGYRWYGLDADERQEIGAMLGTSLLGIDWNLGFFHDTGVSGQYLELTGQHKWQLLDSLALRTSAGISYSNEYWGDNSGLNNAVFRLDLPITLRDWCTLTPWVSASIPFDAIDNLADDEIFGGVNLQVSF